MLWFALRTHRDTSLVDETLSQQLVWYGLAVDLSLGRHWFVQLSGERTEGELEKNDQGFVGYTVDKLALAAPGGDLDVFVAKLDATGTRLEFATYLGGAGMERVDREVGERSDHEVGSGGVRSRIATSARSNIGAPGLLAMAME